MKLAILLLTLCCSVAYAQNNNAIFKHGSSDGFSFAGAQQPVSTISNAIFAHSVGDGFDTKSFREVISASNNAIFKHGSGDGFDKMQIAEVPPITNNNIFSHDAGDGFDEENFNQTSSLNVQNAIYSHSEGDGFSVINYNQTSSLAVNNAIFKHGDADGFAFNNYNQASSLAINNGIFKHGAGDGFVSDFFREATNNSIFQHGPGDGFSFFTLGSTGSRIAQSSSGEIIAAVVTIHPNPTDGKFSVSWTDVSTIDNRQIQIFNMKGIKVYDRHIQGTVGEVDLSIFASGVYVMYCIENESVTTHRIVVY